MERALVWGTHQHNRVTSVKHRCNHGGDKLFCHRKLAGEKTSFCAEADTASRAQSSLPLSRSEAHDVTRGHIGPSAQREAMARLDSGAEGGRARVALRRAAGAPEPASSGGARRGAGHLNTVPVQTAPAALRNGDAHTVGAFDSAAQGLLDRGPSRPPRCG